MTQTAEHQRLLDHREFRANWRNWGPYLSERAWGTVREDYSAGGDAWQYFPHDHARSRAYRWNEDGLMGISDRNQSLCFALALWNGQDHILKERLFGLTGPQGNHGEDVKEQYFYLDNTPTHSYMKMLYKYPQAAFPYAELVEENQRRGYEDDEYELLDTGIFDDSRYFDVLIEYAKADENDILVQITATNRGPEAAPLHLLPTLWFRNTWSWGYEEGPLGDTPTRPCLQAVDVANGGPDGAATIRSEHPESGPYLLHADALDGDVPDLLFTENETNRQRLFGVDDDGRYTKDAFHRYLVDGEQEAINPQREGTKGAVVYSATLEPGETLTVRLRLSTERGGQSPRSKGLRSRRRPSLLLISTKFCSSAGTRPTSSTKSSSAALRASYTPRRGASSGRPLPGCCGASSFITTTWSSGWRAIRASRSRRAATKMGATAIGSTCTTWMQFRCRTSGSTPGMPPGIRPFTCCPLR